jgi:predicted RNA-binding protein with PUA domain
MKPHGAALRLDGRSMLEKLPLTSTAELAAAFPGYAEQIRAQFTAQ